MRWIAILILVAAVALLPSTASAIYTGHYAGYAVDEWRGDPGGTYAEYPFNTSERVGVVAERIKFEVITEFRPQWFRLCVTPPGRGPTCHRFLFLREFQDGASKRIDFISNFPHQVRGRYTVRWYWRDHHRQHGEALDFNYPKPYRCYYKGRICPWTRNLGEAKVAERARDPDA